MLERGAGAGERVGGRQGGLGGLGGGHQQCGRSHALAPGLTRIGGEGARHDTARHRTPPPRAAPLEATRRALPQVPTHNQAPRREGTPCT